MLTRSKMDGQMIKLPFGFLKQHLVPILLIFEKNGRHHPAAMTAFVLSAQDRWFLITAGHCLDEVNQMTDSGWELQRSYLLDSFHLNVQSIDAVPFLYYSAHPTRSNQLDIGLDYGVLTLSDYYRILLETNGIQALSEEAWLYPPENADSYWLLGIPKELTRINLDSESVNLEPIGFEVERVFEPLQGFTEAHVPRFYGQIWPDNGMTSIGGVSGGPIFGFQHLGPEKVRYWLVAVQSVWLPQSHYIAACYAKTLGEALAEYVRNRG